MHNRILGVDSNFVFVYLVDWKLVLEAGVPLFRIGLGNINYGVFPRVSRLFIILFLLFPRFRCLFLVDSIDLRNGRRFSQLQHWVGNELHSNGEYLEIEVGPCKINGVLATPFGIVRELTRAVNQLRVGRMVHVVVFVLV